jgi:hypothetical protein
MVFKIHGERNSGTKFLTELFEANFGFGCFQEYYHDNRCYYWKHGIDFEKRTTSQIDIFIIRNLEDWLISMFYKPYHLALYNDFNSFITQKQILNDGWSKDGNTGLPLNYHDKDKTIFEIRYFKLRYILDYASKNSNVVLVNLDYIKNPDNCKLFLEMMIKIYNLSCNKMVLELPYEISYTKQINIDEYRNTIDKAKNKEYEEFVQNLTFSIKYSP